MKYLKKIIPLVIAVFLLGTGDLFSQKKGGRHGHPHKGHHPHAKRVVKRSVFRPAKVVVYRPVWGPKHYIHRRRYFSQNTISIGITGVTIMYFGMVVSGFLNLRLLRLS